MKQQAELFIPVLPTLFRTECLKLGVSIFTYARRARPWVGKENDKDENGSIINLLDIIHRPVFIKNNVSETGFCLRPQIKSETETSLRNVVFNKKTGRWIMSKRLITVLMSNRHKLYDLIYENGSFQQSPPELSKPQINEKMKGMKNICVLVCYSKINKFWVYIYIYIYIGYNISHRLFKNFTVIFPFKFKPR
jgi:hypothetical protein